MSGLDYKVASLNLRNIEYHQSVAENRSNLVLKFVYLKDLDDLDTFNISGLDGENESEKEKGRLDITAIINYKTPFVAS